MSGVCTCEHYVVDYSDPERYHAENVDRELTPGCPEHDPASRPCLSCGKTDADCRRRWGIGGCCPDCQHPEPTP